MSDPIKKRRPTIRDVAREAGVSYQTVSRVLNDNPNVAPATRQHVLQMIERMGYKRNLAAQMLTTQRSNTIQMITLDVAFPLSLPVFAQYAYEAGYSTLYSECTMGTFAATLNAAASRLVEGIFLYAPRLAISDGELLALCHGIPLVRRDFVLDSKLTWVGFDQIRSTQLGVQHLIDLGHRQIAEITGSMDFINPRLRHEGWQHTLEDNGLEPGPVHIGDYSSPPGAMRTGYEGVCDFLRHGASFSAIMTVNDHVAIGALHALREHGLRVPEDVSILGFDDAPIARYLAPPLTTVRFDFDLQNRLAFQFLFEQINEPNCRPHQHILVAELITRDSTRALT